jgi:hypothetical protein
MMTPRERLLLALQVVLWWAHRLGGKAVSWLHRWGWTLVLCWPAAAHAMPPLLAAVATAAISAGAFGAGITMATAVFGSLTIGNMLFIATAVYGAVEQRRAAKKARAAANAAATDRMAPNMSASEAPWQVIYGEATVGPCQVAAQLTSGARDEFKYVVYIWSAHECQQFMETYINGQPVGALDGTGLPTTPGKWVKANSGNTRTDTVTLNASAAGVAPQNIASIVSISYETGSGDAIDSAMLQGSQITLTGGAGFTVQAPNVAAWAGRTVQISYAPQTAATSSVRIQHHLGTADQTANAMLLAECPGEWTATDRLRGLCYSVVRFSLDEPEFQGGPPQVTVRLRGKRVFDPRTSTTAWNDNVALCVADFLTAEYGKTATSGQVQWPTVTAAANACDETLASQAGAKRYTCNGAFRTDGDPDNTLDELCQAMAGFATWNGTWALQAGVYTAPVATVDDSWNAGSVEVMADQESAAVFNGLKGRFYDPSRFDQRTDYAPYQNAAFKAADNNLDLWDDLDLPFTNTQWRAQNLARIQVERSRGMQLVSPCNMRALSLRPGQRVTYINSLLGITGSVFRVVKRDFQLGQPVMLTLQQDAADNYDEADAVAPPANPSNLNPDPFVVAAPAGVVVTSGDTVTQLGSDGSIISRVRLTLTASDDVLVINSGALQIETRRPNNTGAPPAATDWVRQPEAPGSTTSVQLLGLVDRLAYVGRVRWRNGLGAVSPWVNFSVVVQGSLAPTRNAFAATRVWNFTAGTADGWTAAGGSVLGSSGGFVTHTSSGTDPNLLVSGLAINGRLSPLVRMRLRRTAGSGWQGDLYYTTSGHGDSESFKKKVPTVPPTGQWVIIEWDMANLTAGGTDWVSSTINALRFDLGTTAADVFEIDWIALGYVGPGTEGADFSLNVFNIPENVSNATADLTLVADGAVQISGNTATKTGTTSAWDASFRSQQSYRGGFYIEFVPTANNVDWMVGANTSTDLTDASFGTIDYALNGTGAGVLRFYQSGGTPAQTSTYNGGDVLAMKYDGYRLEYLKNGVTLRTEFPSSALASAPFFLDSSLFSPGVRLRSIRFIPLSLMRDLLLEQMAEAQYPQFLNSYQVIGQNLLSESDQAVAVRFAVRWNPNNAVLATDGGAVVSQPQFTEGTPGWSTANYILSAGRTKSVYVREMGRVTTVVNDPATDGAGNLRCADFEITPDAPVVAGQRYFASCSVFTLNCRFTLFLLFQDYAGNLLSFHQDGPRTTSGLAPSTLSVMTRAQCSGVAPTNAATARLVITKWTTSPGFPGGSYMFWAAPQIEAAATNQAASSPYSPGPVAAIGTDQLQKETAAKVFPTLVSTKPSVSHAGNRALFYDGQVVAAPRNCTAEVRLTTDCACSAAWDLLSAGVAIFRCDLSRIQTSGLNPNFEEENPALSGFPTAQFFAMNGAASTRSTVTLTASIPLISGQVVKIGLALFGSSIFQGPSSAATAWTCRVDVTLVYV